MHNPYEFNPLFQKILGSSWEELGSVVRGHYFLRGRSNDYICVSGVMEEINHSIYGKLLIPFGLLFGAIVPFKGVNVPVDVHYSAKPENSNIYWDRVFKFPSFNFHFKSYMYPVKDNKVIEFVRFGIGIKLDVSVEDLALIFRDTGYIWRIFGFNLPLPGRWLMGSVYVEERPIDDKRFSMKMVLNHPWFGELFKYAGKFELNA